MMLTFPALNGVGLLTGERQDLYIMKESMVPMILTNGMLCFVYILILLFISRLKSKRLSMFLVLFSPLLSVVLWMIIARYLPASESWPWLLCYSLIILIGVWKIWQQASVEKNAKVQTIFQRMGSNTRNVIQDYLKMFGVRSNVCRITGFFVLGLLILALVYKEEIAFAGKFSAFPLLPFFTLFLISYDNRGATQHSQMIRQMGCTVLFGPLVAIGFVTVFVYYLSSFLPSIILNNNGFQYYLFEILGLLVGWSLCFLIICSVMWAASKFDEFHYR